MNATIWCDSVGEAAGAQSVLAGRGLTLRLRALPGFVAFVVLAAESGGTAAICICEDAESLAAANGLIAQWGREDGAGGTGSLAPLRTGEVIVQKGL